MVWGIVKSITKSSNLVTHVMRVTKVFPERYFCYSYIEPGFSNNGDEGGGKGTDKFKLEVVVGKV